VLKAEAVKFVHFCQWIVMFMKGLELSFWSAVFITSVGHIDTFPSAKRLTGLCGMFVGAGEILGLYIFVFLYFSVYCKQIIVIVDSS